MRKLPLTLAALATALFAIVLATGWALPNHWRQEITLHAVTPDGPVQNTTIVEYRYLPVPSRIGRNRYERFGVFGDSPHVELAPGKVLFALNLYDVFALPIGVARKLGIDHTQKVALFEEMKSMPDPVNLDIRDYPVLITFEDLDDPSTVQLVNPHNIAATFGPGYDLKAISTLATHKPVSRGAIAGFSRWMLQSNAPFNPRYQQKQPTDPNIGNFNRSVLSRHLDCVIPAWLMNNITYGFRTRGAWCRY